MISWLRYADEPLDTDLLPAAHTQLNEIERKLAQWKQPASDEQLVECLQLIADTIQVTLPNENGLMVYIALLEDTPAEIVKQACIDTLKTHTYKTMPLPGEILQTYSFTSWQWQYEWLLACIEQCRKKLNHLNKEKENGKADS